MLRFVTTVIYFLKLQMQGIVPAVDPKYWGKWVFIQRCIWKHFSDAAECQNFLSPNSLSVSSLIKTQTHPFLLLLCGHCESYSHIRSKESTHIHSALKTLKSLTLPWLCVWVIESPCDERKFTACHLSSDKSSGKNKSKIGVPTEAVERAPSRDTNCFPPLLYTALTWSRPRTSITSHLNGTSLPL